MKNHRRPIVTATRSLSNTIDNSLSSNDTLEPVIRLRIDKPLHWDWELTTSADILPVIQLLDKDGRLLVETTGKKAQKARGSFRDGLISHEEYPQVSRSLSSSSVVSLAASPPISFPTGNRNVDGYSTKFGSSQAGYLRKKSDSDASLENVYRKKESIARARCDKLQDEMINQQQLDKVRALLCRKLREKMEEEEEKGGEISRLSRIEQRRPRKVCSETNVMKCDSSTKNKVFQRNMERQRRSSSLGQRGNNNNSTIALELPSRKSTRRVSSCSSERKKHYRKTKSDVLLGQTIISNPDRPATTLQENYLLVENPNRIIGSPDFGYNTIPKSGFVNYRELYDCSRVKKSDTFKIVDGGEDFVSDTEDTAHHIEGSLANKTNEDITKDYFNRVYELLKKRLEDARLVANGYPIPGYDDSSSSNYVEKMPRKRIRRKKKDRVLQASDQHRLNSRASPRVRSNEITPGKIRVQQGHTDNKSIIGEEVVTVPPSVGGGVGGNGGGGQEPWKVQRVLINGDSLNNAPSNILNNNNNNNNRRSDSGGKRIRSAPSALISSKVSAKDIRKFFDWPNKENSPRNAVIHRDASRSRESFFGPIRGDIMGSNLSRHSGKGLNGRRTQSSGNLCDSKSKLNIVGKILVPCSSAQRERRYKFCGSLPNHLDDKDVLDEDRAENNNVTSDTISGNLGGTLPHKKRSLGVHFSNGGPNGTLDLVKHRSQESLDENDPWRYQQTDLDLVRCRRGNLDSVRRNRSVDTVSRDSSKRSSRGGGTSLGERYYRNSDLDLVGTLPKRKQDSRCSNKSLETTSSSSQPCIAESSCGGSSRSDDDILMNIVHKPDCELIKHRQQVKGKGTGAVLDLKLTKLGAFGEPQDQGYASERSPEEEHPPTLPGQPFPTVTPESTFRVTLQKSSRGLGLSVSGGGTAGPVRVKRLFPQQPAALSNKLQPGDILLAANGIPLTGLTNYEALEVLRMTPNTVELVVCRLPGESDLSPPGIPPPPPVRRELGQHSRILNPLPPLQIEPCGEFDIEMTKVGGSLGFTLRKVDSSALGHYVRALVREPALSDGRIQPGDKIVAVDGAPLSSMTHEEAVSLLRQCGPKVKLRLYRDLTQTPVSALSPTEPDYALHPARTNLRQEAVDMLCDLAVRKLSPGTSSGSSCKQSPRRHRRLASRTPTADYEQEEITLSQTSDSDQCSIKTQITLSQPNTPSTDIIDPPALYDVCDSSDSSLKPSRPSFLDLSATSEKAHFQFSVDSDGEYPQSNFKSSIYEDQDNNLPTEPASMPPVLSSNDSNHAAFSYKNPAYQSANPSCNIGIDSTGKIKTTHSSDQDIPGKILGTDDPHGSKGLLKWKGVTFAPEEMKEKDEKKSEQDNEVFMVELTRGWNSRLGFSLQAEGNQTVISVIHSDSVAAKDGRLRQGDVLLMVNDENVENTPTSEIIDLLRKIRGSIGITVMRKHNQQHST